MSLSNIVARFSQAPSCHFHIQDREMGVFMAKLRERDMPVAIHSALGSTGEPTRYLPWTEEALRLHPDNKIIMPLRAIRSRLLRK